MKAGIMILPACCVVIILLMSCKIDENCMEEESAEYSPMTKHANSEALASIDI